MLKYRAGTVLIAAFMLFQSGCGGGGSTTTGDVLEAVADTVVTPDTATPDTIAPPDTVVATDVSGCETDCGEMVSVPAGLFMMGCNAEVDTECNDDEKPRHQVYVPTFEIDKYEVTVDLYKACVDAGQCTEPVGKGSSLLNWGVSGKEEHPANGIDWYQAKVFCAWSGKRLCSESEWEKASRGTDGRKYPWGNETATCAYAVMDETGAVGGVTSGCGTYSTMAVGSKPNGVSPCGAMDMSGNVSEWVEDDYHDLYSGAPNDGSAWVDEPRASFRVSRGGSFYSNTFNKLRSSLRESELPAAYGAILGTRCCRSL